MLRGRCLPGQRTLTPTRDQHRGEISMQLITRVRSVFHVPFVLLGLGVLFSATGLAQVNAVYVESNVGKTANKNSVYAFANDGTGKLKQIIGSPYLTGGTG